MAFPPTIPTSFVPRPSSAAPRKFRADFTNAFDFVAYVVLGIVFTLAIGVFFYGRILSASQSTKDAALAQAASTIDPTTVDSFLRLRDRLSSGKTLLANHVAFSGALALLETLIPARVRLIALNLSINDAGTVELEGAGVAKSFNALAAASTVLARDGRIKDAIFSGIAVDPKDRSVSFTLSASLDPKVVAFSPKALVASSSVSESVPITTP